MADRTLGFKVTDEVHERARMLIETSGLTAKEWIENALTMYEVKALQASTPDYAKDLTELETFFEIQTDQLLVAGKYP